MKFYKSFHFTFFLLLPIVLYSQEFNILDFSDNMIGTYMPLLFISELTRTNNYREAMIKNENRYYDVICINKNIVYSNLKFHDQFAISSNDVQLFHFDENNGTIELTDKNGYKYVKISGDINYYKAYRIYVNNYFFNILNKFQQNIIFKTDDGFIYNDKRWIINLDILNYPKDDNFMYFHEERDREYIGIKYSDNEIEFYTLEPDEDDYLANRNKEKILVIE
jgi:hypothetical protein